MKVSDFLDLDVIHQAFSLRKENPKDDTFRSAQGGKRYLYPTPRIPLCVFVKNFILVGHTS